MKSNSIKMYDKFNCLRIEMTINAPREFKVYREVQHRECSTSMRWVPMGNPSLTSIGTQRYQKRQTRGFLTPFAISSRKKALEKEINSVCAKKKVHGRQYTGYHVWSPETFALFEAISDGKYLIRGFTNKEIRKTLYPQKASSKQISGKVSREFAQTTCPRTDP